MSEMAIWPMTKSMLVKWAWNISKVPSCRKHGILRYLLFQQVDKSASMYSTIPLLFLCVHGFVFRCLFNLLEEE